MIIALVHYRLRKYHFNVKTTCLNSNLKEEVYLEQPKGFQIKGEEKKVLRSLQALYGLYQVPHTWYENIDKYLKFQTLYRNDVDYNLYYVLHGKKVVIHYYKQ